ncbi:MAG: helicase-related protein [Fermentimonas sp.]|nr:helicase-related protein [Fermentimonas sp.]
MSPDNRQNISTMNFTPGQRITNRGEDFIINDIEENKGSWILKVEGISELVKAKQFIFDTNIDSEIRVLDPVNTKLVADTDFGYRKTKLFIENQIRNSPVYSKYITIAHKAAFNEAKYQYEPTLKAFDLPRPRMLIADGVGLGKTIEVGIFLAEMIKRGKGKRIMVLALKSILGQFQQEIWNRFAIPLVRLDSEGISKIKSELPVNKNPFDYYDKTIVSIDTLKNNAKYQHFIEKSRWDIIVIDECHTVANSDSLRGGLAQLLSTKCESLILTSATPHNGKKENFANLINMIEPLAIKDESSYTKENILPYYVRRFKNDIDDATVKSNFQEREVISIHAPLNPAEEDFLEMQQNIKFTALSALEGEDFSLENNEVSTDIFGKTGTTKNKKKQKKDLLFAISLFKSYMSSPEAALKSVENRIDKIQQSKGFNDLVEENIEVLNVLKEKLESIISLKQDAKYNAFKNELIKLKWNGRKNDFRIVVFAERIETLNSLKVKLQHDFNLEEKVIAAFHGSLSDMEQQSIIEDFGKEDSDFRILLTSDAGSQGVNLHYYCNHMFNYDIPWSLITLEQRNGRIDRYGQTKTPYIHYMVTTSELEGLKVDLHIVNKLKEKEDEVYKALGDAASVYKLYDATAEENLVIEAISTQDETVLEENDQSLKEDETWDALFNNTTPPIKTDKIYDKSVSLYPDDKSYYEALIMQLKSDGYLENDAAYFDGDLLEVKNTPELDRIMYDIPTEAKPNRIGSVYQLSLDKETVQNSISEARKRKGEWAQFQVLYELHPIISYLMTQLEASVDKDVALVSKLNRLPKGTAHYLLQGISANSLGQSIVSDFFMISMNLDGSMYSRPIPFSQFLIEYKLNEDQYTLEIKEDDIKLLEKMLPDVINNGHILYMDQKQQEVQNEMEEKMVSYKEKMDEWRRSKESQLEIEFADKPEYGYIKKRKRDKEVEIQTILDNSSRYFQDLTSLKGDPYLKVIAVFYNK